MLGFAIVDRQPAADATAVWLTSRTDTTIVRNTNAVVIPHDDPDHDSKVQWLISERSVVLTEETTPLPPFENAVQVELFEVLVKSTTAHQERICRAVDDYSRRQRSKLVVPVFQPVPELAAAAQDEPRFRALAVANYIGNVWTAWLFTEEQRLRRTVNPRTGETPWIMPEDLNDPAIAIFPAEFSDRVRPAGRDERSRRP
ncbi:hypothetical protein [Nocardia cerradoensis]|uniref:Uncharacterized protein n=1 Tax=Nocardia cerradoensis TaxID=85688 RepID=A0A231GTZ7_9NOCA|nr:hypothetical protein [Nocardia cerradoensis]NKY44310.1 hypothetical protein [Nocardia cerradoensis]OXR39961.1 hypothetical protein B7C42_07968 [Nocardia cerradoensis]